MIMDPKTGNVVELLKNTSEKLRKQINTHNKTEEDLTNILKAFGLDSLISAIPLELFTLNDIGDQKHTYQVVVERVREESNKYFISQLETKIGFLRSFNLSSTANQGSVKKILEAYRNEYETKSEGANQDLLNISSLQTSVHKLQSEIHQANEQQEHKKNIITKFQECTQIKSKIDKYREEDKVLTKELEHYRPLPPDLSEAQRKLDQLKQKFRQISDELTHIIQKGY